MAEIEKAVGEEIETPEGEEIDVELEEDSTQTTIEEAVSETEAFYKNLAEDMSDEVLQRMSNQLLDDYKKDRVSRKDWETSYTNNLDLLGIKHTEMTRPFKGSASVTHPLLSEAVTQFQAQAYKELLPSSGPVRTRVLGMEDDQKINQAQRVQDFMNYMITEEMEEYTPEFDQLLFYLALAGSAFKKVYYDEVMQRAVSKFIPAEDLVVPYYATDLMDCERITHVIKMGENEILKKQEAGFYRDVELKPTSTGPSDIEKKYQELEGITPSGEKQYSYSILEMHVDCNLEEFEMQDADKQVKVPYIVTIDEGSGQILSVYRNYDMNDETKKRKEYFVHFKFLPGLGFYGFGLTHMIGGLSRTATQSLRQLLDAGTLSNLPAGFKSRGIRIRDDDQPFQPGEFRDVDAPGGNIKDQFQILPFKEPSATLYQLMGFVVQAGQKFAAITNMDTGNDMQNRAVGTTVSLLERGSRVMSAIHKRCYYSMRREFRLLSKVFATYLPPIYPYSVYGADQAVKQTDFDDRVDVIPVADPNIMSMAQRVTLANENLKIAMSNPMMHNLREAYRRVYEALGTQDIDQILKPIERPMPKDPATENMESLMMKPLKAFPTQDHQAHIAAHRAFISTRMVQINPQVYGALQAHISEHVSLLAQGEVGAAIENNPEMQQMLQADPQAAQIRIEAMVAQRVAELTIELAQSEAMGQQKDPIVMLKQRELDLRAMDLQRKSEESMMNMDIKENQIEEQLDIEKMKLENNEAQAAERIRVAEEKLEIQRQKNKGKK
ncbi:hypothetical protein HTVC023P_gp31 [Pelagibacter phage HTVC023P]|nr:hypothetical protein HTVC023P_gp31 [Pelagibacter phage HTVC023P]